MVGLAIQIVAFVIVAYAVIVGGMALLGLLGIGISAVSDSGKGKVKQDPKPEPLSDDNPLDKKAFESLLDEYSKTITSMQNPDEAKNYAKFFEAKFLIGKRLMRMMLNIEDFYTFHYQVPRSWKNRVISQENVKYSKESLILNMNNIQVVLLPEEKEIPYFDYADTVYKRKIRVLQKKNIVFEEELNYGDKHGSYYFLHDIDKRFTRTYAAFIFKPSQWLFDLFNLCIDDVIEFKRIKHEENVQNLIASQNKVKQDYYPA